MSNQLVILHLSLLEKIGPKVIQKLIALYGDRLDELYACSVTDLLSKGCTERVATLVREGLRNLAVRDQELERIARHKVSWCTMLDDQYPSLLKEIYAPPPVLYWYGHPPTHQSMLAIVGSRKAHHYSRSFVNEVVPPLIHKGWTIVSGGAIGADTMAHQATVNEGGKTVVVLGSGLLHPHPPSNRHLFKQVVDTGGTIFSAFPLSTIPQAGNFPARNRIISGMSRGCIVTQAAARSGASITARCALEQGRDVFAVPGPINDPLSRGCHQLIQQGAKLVWNVQDILEEYGQSTAGGSFTEKVMDTNLTIEVLRAQEGKPETVMRLCNQPVTFDDLVAEVELNHSEVQTILFELQLAGKVMQDFAGRWVAV